MKKNKIILMYHSIGATNNGKVVRRPYCVSEEKFRQQMEIIRSQVRSQNSEVIITFDDGDITNYEYALPILKENSLKACFFILVSKVGTPGYMSWGHIRELRDACMIIGSHGMTHRILTTLSDKEIEAELNDSKHILEDNLCTFIKYLSIPRGFYNEAIIQKAKEARYEAIFTSDLGINTETNFDLFRLRRIPIKRSLSIHRFRRILDGNYLIKERVESIFKKTAQALIGIKNYEDLTLRAYNA